MKTVEVPVWLAVVVALGAPLITAAGVVLAQFVNAWRENKGEKIRWQRDKVSETARITLEHSSQWREARISSYAEMAECIARFGSIFGELRSVLSPADSRTKAADLEKLTTRYATVSERVSLICGEELLKCIRRNITTTAVPFSFSYPHDSRGSRQDS